MDKTVYLSDAMTIQSLTLTEQLDNIEKRLNYLKSDFDKFKFMKRLSDITMFGEDTNRLAIFARMLSNSLVNYGKQKKLSIEACSSITVHESKCVDHLSSELQCIEYDLRKFRAVQEKSIKREKLIDEIATDLEALVPYAMRLVNLVIHQNKDLKDIHSTITDLIEHEGEPFLQTEKI